MLLIFQSGKTKSLATELVSLPKMAAWFSTVIFILSCPLNPPPRQLPWSNWWAQIKSDKAVMSPKTHFCGFMKTVTWVGWADVTRTLSAPRLICKEIASCPPKLTDNWGQQEEEDARDYRQMGRMEVFQCVVLRWKTEPRAQRRAGMEEKSALFSSYQT